MFLCFKVACRVRVAYLKEYVNYMCRYDLQNCVWKFFKNKWVSIYLNFGDFKVLKNHSSQENINKTRSTKTQENSAHRFGGNYLTNRLVKFQQDRNKL